MVFTHPNRWGGKGHVNTLLFLVETILFKTIRYFLRLDYRCPRKDKISSVLQKSCLAQTKMWCNTISQQEAEQLVIFPDSFQTDKYMCTTTVKFQRSIWAAGTVNYPWNFHRNLSNLGKQAATNPPRSAQELGSECVKDDFGCAPRGGLRKPEPGT